MGNLISSINGNPPIDSKLERCTCQDKNQEKTVICLNKDCRAQWNMVITSEFEIIERCPQHCIFVCIDGFRVYVCKNCEEKGYHIEYTDGMPSVPILKLRNIA